MQANTSTYNLPMLSWFLQGIVVGSIHSCQYCLKNAQKGAQETQSRTEAFTAINWLEHRTSLCRYPIWRYCSPFQLMQTILKSALGASLGWCRTLEDSSRVLQPCRILYPTYLCCNHVGLFQLLDQVHHNPVQLPPGSAVTLVYSRHNRKSTATMWNINCESNLLFSTFT